jgi:hypothetical protein
MKIKFGDFLILEHIEGADPNNPPRNAYFPPAYSILFHFVYNYALKIAFIFDRVKAIWSAEAHSLYLHRLIHISPLRRRAWKKVFTFNDIALRL